METYLIKSTAILAIFWVLYVLFLEKENMHRFKRFYLLTSIVAAFCIPLLSITQYVYVEPIDGLDLSNATIPFSVNESFEVVETPFWTLERILWSVYILGVTIFSLRFIKNLFSIVKTINTNEKQKQSSITFVLLKTLINPHTFFNFIFLNKLKFQKNEVPKEVLLHEEVHAKQKHSLDILFIELMQIVFWFQPFIWLYKKRIKLNHEFLADQAVIKAGFESSTYQNTLLSYSSHQDYSLANAIDYLSIKKRFTVMKTQTSKQKKWLFSLLILPVLGILFYSFSEREIVEVELEQPKIQETELDKSIKEELRKAESMDLYYVDDYEPAILLIENKNKLLLNGEKTSLEKLKADFLNLEGFSKNELIVDSKDPIEIKYLRAIFEFLNISNDLNKFTLTTSKRTAVIDKNDILNNQKSISFNEASKELMDEYKAFINKYNETKIIFGEAYERAVIIYDQLMDDAQRASVEKYPPRLIPKSNLSKVSPKKLSKTLFEDLKNAEKYAIWIDKKHVSNSELDNYSFNDFVHYTGSKVFKNARSEKFPQPNQYRLFTKEGFKTTYKDSQLRRYNKSTEIYHKAIQDYLKGSQKSDYELRILRAKALNIYKTFSAEEIKMNNIKKPIPVPADSFGDNSTFDEKNQQNPPTAKEVAEYNTWAKKINDQNKKADEKGNNEYALVKVKDIKKYKGIYDRMTKAQKNNAEAWPDFPPLPIKPHPGYKKTKQNLPPPPPPMPKEDKGKVTMGHINAYNEWMTYIKSDKANAKYMTVEIYESYRDLYEAMTDEQKKLTDGAPPPPPPPPSAPKKANKTKGGPNADEIVSDYKSCLEVPKSFITKDGKTLNIKCINDYTKNEFQVFNRWGNLIYSKENYNNNWDGTVEKSFAQDGSDKLISGTYYYVFSSPNLKKEKAGFLIINAENINTKN